MKDYVSALAYFAAGVKHGSVEVHRPFATSITSAFTDDVLSETDPSRESRGQRA